MKILIACDMEGISGVTGWDHVDPSHPEHARFRRIMTDDVNAAVRGAFDAGAEEVVVTDGHWNSTNILIEHLDPRARLNSGTPSPLSMMEGIDENIDGVLFVGYHARAGSQNASLDHTWSSRRVANLWLNGVLVGEYGINAALGGFYGAPVLMISGDQTACAQAVDLLGPLATAVVKQAKGRFSAECLAPSIAQGLIYQAAMQGIHALKEGKGHVFQLEEPVRVAVEFTSSDMADKAALMQGALRVDGRRIEFVAQDIREAYLGFRVLVSLAA